MLAASIELCVLRDVDKVTQLLSVNLYLCICLSVARLCAVWLSGCLSDLRLFVSQSRFSLSVGPSVNL